MRLPSALGVQGPVRRQQEDPRPPPCVSVKELDPAALGMTEILVSDVNLNSVCEHLEQHCCVDPNQHYQSSAPQTPLLKRHTNTGAKLWGRVRSKLLRQKVWARHKTHKLVFSCVHLFVLFSPSSFQAHYSLYLTAGSVVKTKLCPAVSNKQLQMFDLSYPESLRPPTVSAFKKSWDFCRSDFGENSSVTLWSDEGIITLVIVFRRSSDTQTALYFPGYWIIQKYNEESLRCQE